MTSTTRRARLSLLLGASALAAGVSLAVAAAPAIASPAQPAGAVSHGPPGDNGTVKIHRSTTAVSDPANQPHVCVFYLDAFGFDPSQSVSWQIKSWPPTGNRSVVDSGSITLDSQGDGHTANQHLSNGHYKLYWTFAGEKGHAKQKVFWVKCVAKPKPKPKGYLEICKQQSGTGLTGQAFTFAVDGHDYTVPVGACTSSLKVNAGNVTVTEVKRAGSALVSVSTIPASRLVSDNLTARTAVVKVVRGGVSTETIVTFTNKGVPGNGYLKICKVAGQGIAVGTKFTYTVGSQSVQVPAGPAPGGYCVVVGRFPFGDQTITETIPGGDSVSSIRTAPASRQVSADLKTGTATVDIGHGVTEVTYTNTVG